MRKLLAWNNLRWHVRLPVKTGVFVLTVLIVCFPSPFLLARHLRHISDPNALIDPDAAALAPMLEELRPQLSDDLSSEQTLRLVERFVYEKIPYAWDWEMWGVADYMPTVEETIVSGREDCDGRAVVAASILRQLGFQATLVNDLAHVWVRTDAGDTMAPGERPVMVATETGVRIHWEALGALPRALAYGVAVFPLSRELIILGVLWLLMLREGAGWVHGAGGLLLLLGGLWFVRTGCPRHDQMIAWMQWTGVALFLAGCLVLFVCRRIPPAPATTIPNS